jgi:hypothetical protein
MTIKRIFYLVHSMLYQHLETSAPELFAQGLHALKLRVKDPDGDNAPWFSQAVMAGDGTAEINLPIAWNERPGTWTVTVEDLYTGKSAVHVFTVGD